MTQKVLMSSQMFCRELGLSETDFHDLVHLGLPVLKVGTKSYLVDSAAAGTWIYQRKELRVGDWKEEG